MFGFGVAFNIVFKYCGNEFNQNKNHSYRLRSFQVHNLTFYLLSSYLASKRCFIFSVMLPDDMETASKYNMKITVYNYQDAQMKLTYEGSVLSIEDLPNIKDKKANLKYWFVAYDALEPFFRMIQGFNTIPIKLEVLKI